MIGKKVVLRMRMGAADAHYAGDLVNGSHILDVFGDVGTELCIRQDGDESLFVGYEKVEFTAPVYAGDFVEYSGWIEKRGKSSRSCPGCKRTGLSRKSNGHLGCEKRIAKRGRRSGF